MHAFSPGYLLPPAKKQKPYTAGSLFSASRQILFCCFDLQDF
jgi:hypothetical protein